MSRGPVVQCQEKVKKFFGKGLWSNCPVPRKSNDFFVKSCGLVVQYLEKVKLLAYCKELWSSGPAYRKKQFC